MDSINRKLKVEYVPISSLRHPEKNPRTWTKEATEQLQESIQRHGVVDPLIVNCAPERKGIIIGGNFRAEVLKNLKYEKVPVVFISVSDPEKEAELILRLNKNTGDWSEKLLAEFDEDLLADVGFSSEEIDDIFPEDENQEVFDLQKELSKLDIKEITVQKGDVYEWPDGSRVMCGDSCTEADMLKLMNDGAKIDLCLTDPPYRLQYLQGKARHGESTTGFGMKKNRRYLETESLPEDFTTLWMGNVAKIAAKDFSIICYENWKNLREIWGEMEKHWKVRNMLVWHLPNRNQGYSGKHKLFSKHDIAMLGTSEDHSGINLAKEDNLLDEEYHTALFAITGNPHWESYGKNKKYCPTDFIEFNAADEKSSGQGIIFGVKPLPILIPYVKILTERGNLVLEPFGGSGSTAAAAATLKRRFRLMEKSPVYTQVILRRLQRLTGLTPEKIHD